MTSEPPRKRRSTLGERPDFDDWAAEVVSAVEQRGAEPCGEEAVDRKSPSTALIRAWRNVARAARFTANAAHELISG